MQPSGRRSHETTEDAAYSAVTFGRAKVTYQSAAEDEDWCRAAAKPAEAIIERHQMEAFFLFGWPLWTFEQSTNPARECEHCSPNAIHAELSASERREIFDDGGGPKIYINTSDNVAHTTVRSPSDV